MKVEDLIRELRKLDKDQDISFFNEHGEALYIDEIIIEYTYSDMKVCGYKVTIKEQS